MCAFNCSFPGQWRPVNTTSLRFKASFKGNNSPQMLVIYLYIIFYGRLLTWEVARWLLRLLLAILAYLPMGVMNVTGEENGLCERERESCPNLHVSEVVKVHTYYRHVDLDSTPVSFSNIIKLCMTGAALPCKLFLPKKIKQTTTNQSLISYLFMVLVMYPNHAYKI